MKIGRLEIKWHKRPIKLAQILEKFDDRIHNIEVSLKGIVKVLDDLTKK